MEVGAVKQAFNNEVVHLKKTLNQSKIHVIHKLTRKAKTLTDKKAPEHLKEKLRRKAESAINEVLIIKKIKPRDIAKFIITHTGEVQDYINKPNVDNDKACARLVLHKSLQEKYKFIRNRFGNVPINDLFMSRQERRKIKKEAREQQKNKKKGKESKVVNGAGNWDIEAVNVGDNSKDHSNNDVYSDDKSFDDKSVHSDTEENGGSDSENDSEPDTEHQIDKNIITQSDESNSDHEAVDDSEEGDAKEKENDDDGDSDEIEDNLGKLVKLVPQTASQSFVKTKQPKRDDLTKIETTETNTSENEIQRKKQPDKQIKRKKQTDTKVKENKNKNLKEKLQNRQFKKDNDEVQIEGRKVVDPFFKTATGENYLSLAEPRLPDEVKDIHKQGNRQERRAAMFGHVAKKPRREHFQQNNFKSNKFGQDDFSKSGPNAFRNNNDRFSNGANFNDRSSKFNDRNTTFNDRNDKFNARNTKFSDGNSQFSDKRNSNYKDTSLNSRDEKKEEKLHPSWEAKRKLKSMSLLPAQGKRIVFNDN